MSAISVVDHHVIYENPNPQIRSRHGYFSGLVKLPSGELLALFALGEALEAADVTRSCRGRVIRGTIGNWRVPYMRETPSTATIPIT